MSSFDRSASHQNVIVCLRVRKLAKPRTRDSLQRRPHHVVTLAADVERHARVQLPAPDDHERVWNPELKISFRYKTTTKRNPPKIEAVLIKLVSPQAAQQGFHFLMGKTQCCTSLMDLFKYTLTEDRKRNKPSTQRELNPRPLCYKGLALPLCYKCCPWD